MQGVRNPALTVEQLDMAFGDHPDVLPYEPHPEDEHLIWWRINTPVGCDFNEWPELSRKRKTIAPCNGQIFLQRHLKNFGKNKRYSTTHHSATLLFNIIWLRFGTRITFAVGEAIGDPTIPMKVLAGLGSVTLLNLHLAQNISGKVRKLRNFD